MSQFGHAQSLSLSRCLVWQELYGNQVAGRLLSCFSRLLTYFLQHHGFTCGIRCAPGSYQWSVTAAQCIRTTWI